MLDQHAAVGLHELLPVGTAWAVMADPDQPLVTLTLQFHAPVTGTTAIVLLAAKYARCWQHIVGGGMIAITTADRLGRTGPAAHHHRRRDARLYPVASAT